MVTQKTHMNENISFLRIRPCDNSNEIYLNSRRKEGTSAFLIKSELDLDISEIHKNCLLYTSPSPRDEKVSRMPSSA